MTRTSALRNLGQPFYLLFVAGVLSDICGFSTMTALQVHVLRNTGGNAAYMGWIAVATLLPMIVAAPIGGVWAERHNRRNVLLLCNVVRIPLLLAMCFLQSVWWLLGLHAATCAVTALFMPSRQSLIPELVPGQHLHLANSLNSGVASLVHMMGPSLGVFLFHVLGGLWGVASIEALALAVSALLLLGLPKPSPSGKHPQTDTQTLAPAVPTLDAATDLLSSVRAGFRYVHGEPDLRQILTMLVSAGAAIGLLVPLLMPFVQQVLRGDERMYASLVFWFGVGGMVGPFVGHALGKTFGLGKMLLLCSLAEALLLTLWSRIGQPVSSRALLVVWGIEVMALIPCYTSYLHLYARKEFMGRTFALFDQATYVPQILSAGVVVLLGASLPAQTILTAAGICYTAILLCTLRTRGARLLWNRREPV